MEYKYPEGIEIIVKNISNQKIKNNLIFYDNCLNNCEPRGSFKVGQKAILKHHNSTEPSLMYYLNLGEGYVSDWFSEQEIEYIIGGEENLKKPPLGVTPINIFEKQRILNLAGAIYEYIESDTKDYDLLIEWADELKMRINFLKVQS
jgi:hypothetical protein